MTEFRYVLPEEQQQYLDDGWEIVGPAKWWGVISLLARREIARTAIANATATED